MSFHYVPLTSGNHMQRELDSRTIEVVIGKTPKIIEVKYKHSCTQAHTHILGTPIFQEKSSDERRLKENSRFTLFPQSP